MIREIDGGGSSHISQNSVIAHFGLGNATNIDKITVYWTGGNKQTLTGVPANQLLTITEVPVEKPGNLYVYLTPGFILAAVILFAIVYVRRRNKKSFEPHRSIDT